MLGIVEIILCVLFRYPSEHNQKGKRYFLTHLSDKYSPRKIECESPLEWSTFLYYLCMCLCYVGAVHRYYESRRRLYNDSKPNRVDRARKYKHVSKKKETRKWVKNNDYDASLIQLACLSSGVQCMKKVLNPARRQRWTAKDKGTSSPTMNIVMLENHCPSET